MKRVGVTRLLILVSGFVSCVDLSPNPFMGLNFIVDQMGSSFLALLTATVWRSTHTGFTVVDVPVVVLKSAFEGIDL